MARKRANIVAFTPLVAGEKIAMKYDPEFCWKVRLMAQKGMFPEEWCAELGATMSTIYHWANIYPDFDEAVSIAWHILHAYYAKMSRNIVEQQALNSDLKSTVFLEILRKRFPETWGPNPRNTHETFELRNRAPEDESNPLVGDSEDVDLKNMEQDELMAQIEALQARLKHAEPKK